ncbi:50S ribosomal protein L7ae [archaeon]|nr:50S ribosomal protein L7ae [archaeon]
MFLRGVKGMTENLLELVQKVSTKGKIRVGTNETTKAIERGQAKLVVVAEDVQPKELVMHLSLLCKEKNIPITFIKTRKELGTACGIEVPAASIAVIDEGEVKKELLELVKKLSKKGE